VVNNIQNNLFVFFGNTVQHEYFGVFFVVNPFKWGFLECAEPRGISCQKEQLLVGCNQFVPNVNFSSNEETEQ